MVHTNLRMPSRLSNTLQLRHPMLVNGKLYKCNVLNVVRKNRGNPNDDLIKGKKHVETYNKHNIFL